MATPAFQVDGNLRLLTSTADLQFRADGTVPQVGLGSSGTDLYLASGGQKRMRMSATNGVLSWGTGELGVAGNALTLYVDGSVSTTGDGSFVAPFKTIQEALNSVPMPVDGHDQMRRINVCVHSGVYPENLIIPFGRLVQLYAVNGGVTLGNTWTQAQYGGVSPIGGTTNDIVFYNDAAFNCSIVGISAVTNAGGGLVQFTTVSAHGYTTGQTVVINGTTNYNGHWVATVVDGTHFTIVATYVAETPSPRTAYTSRRGATAIASITSSTGGNVLVTTTLPHGLANADSVDLFGVKSDGTASAYNGTYTVANATTTTFTVTSGFTAETINTFYFAAKHGIHITTAQAARQALGISVLPVAATQSSQQNAAGWNITGVLETSVAVSLTASSTHELYLSDVQAGSLDGTGQGTDVVDTRLERCNFIGTYNSGTANIILAKECIFNSNLTVGACAGLVTCQFPNAIVITNNAATTYMDGVSIRYFNQSGSTFAAGCFILPLESSGTVSGQYSVAVNGGTVAGGPYEITIAIPQNSVVLRATVVALSTFTSGGSATLGFGFFGAATDIAANIPYTTLTQGTKLDFLGCNHITTADHHLMVTVGGADLTAGVLEYSVDYAVMDNATVDGGVVTSYVQIPAFFPGADAPQGTNNTTAVATTNARTGTVTMNAPMAGAEDDVFQVNNSLVTSSSVILLSTSAVSLVAGTPVTLNSAVVGSGHFFVHIVNADGTNATTAKPVIRYVIIS